MKDQTHVELIPVIEDDLSQLDEWLQREHVQRWWGDPRENQKQLRAWPPDDLMLIVADGVNVGCVCWSHPSRQELDDAGLHEVSTSVIDIDIMIGEPDSLGKRIGTRAIRLALERILLSDRGIPAVMAGTSVKNAMAIRALHKAGFWIDRVFDDPVGGPFLLMWTDRHDRSCPFMNIRAADGGDVQRLLPLMEEFNREEGFEWHLDRSTTALRRLLEHSDLGYVMVIEDIAPIGYAVVTYNFDLEFGGRDAFITDFFVDATARGTGVSSALLHAVESHAREKDVRALHLQVRPENRSAYRLYGKFGYDHVPRETLTKVLPAD